MDSFNIEETEKNYRQLDALLNQFLGFHREK
jgi:hypothetical protein